MHTISPPYFLTAHKLPPERGEEEGVYMGGITLRAIQDRSETLVRRNRRYATMPHAGAQAAQGGAIKAVGALGHGGMAKSGPWVGGSVMNTKGNGTRTEHRGHLSTMQQYRW